MPSNDTSSLSRAVFVSCVSCARIGRQAKKKSGQSLILNFLKRQQTKQQAIEKVRTMDRVVDDSFTVHLDFHIRQARGQHGVGSVEIDGPDDATNVDDLIFRVHVQILSSFDNQVSVHQHVGHASRDGGGQGSVAAGGAFTIE